MQQKATVQGRKLTVQSKIAGDNSAEGESTTEVTTEKKEESTTATESQESQTSSERDTSSGNTEHSQTEHTTESTKRNTSSGTSDEVQDQAVRYRMSFYIRYIREIPLIVTKKEQTQIDSATEGQDFLQEKMQRFVQRRLRRLRIS
ncbi:MAG: hypothetical protein ACLVH3_17175 [Blautia obeum]